MKKILTKIISIFTSAAISASVLFGTPLSEFRGLAAEVSAASTESDVLAAIKRMANGDYGAEYKAGNFWNTKTSSACTDHGTPPYSSGTGSYDKKYSLTLSGALVSFNNAVQCCGFAAAAFDKLFGDGISGGSVEATALTYSKSGSLKDFIINNAKIGDLIHIENHYFIYTGYNSTHLFAYDANGWNYGATCRIGYSNEGSYTGNKRPWSSSKLQNGSPCVIWHAKNYTLTIDSDNPPPPPSGEHYIVDKNYSGSDPKNIRADKSTGSAILGTIPKNTVCWVTEISGSGSNKWGKVTYGGVIGYINLYYSVVTTTEHQWSDWVTTKAATCTDSGTQIRSCGCGKTEEQTIAATGHKYKDEVIPPTPTTDGYTKHTCTVCGYSYTDNYTPATGTSGTIRIDNTTAVVGQTVQIPIYIDDTKVMGVSVDVKFDPSILKYKSYSDKAFDLVEENADNASNGSLSFACANTSSLTGGKIIVLNFEVVAEKSCSTTISVSSSDATDGEKQIALKSSEATVTVSSALLGDVTGDGKITTQDAIWVLQSVAKKRTLTAAQTSAADVTKDGKVTTQDAIWILQSIVGKRTL